MKSQWRGDPAATHRSIKGRWVKYRGQVLHPQDLTTTGTLKLIQSWAKSSRATPKFCPLLLQGTKTRKWLQHFTRRNGTEHTHTHFSPVSWKVKKSDLQSPVKANDEFVTQQRTSRVSGEKLWVNSAVQSLQGDGGGVNVHRPACNHKNEKHVKTHYSAHTTTDGTCFTHQPVKQNCCSHRQKTLVGEVTKKNQGKKIVLK